MIYAATASFALRPITDADREFLFDLYAETREEELASVPWKSGEREAFLRMQFDAQYEAYSKNYPGATLDLIMDGSKPIGRFYVYRSKSEIRIIDVAISATHRGRGIGTKLITGLLEDSQQKQIPLTIHVEKQNRALKLYERLGFEAIDDRSFYWFMEARPWL
jgi:ribosomal protein S18 acetylase RimI-like enzyme